MEWYGEMFWRGCGWAAYQTADTMARLVLGTAHIFCNKFIGTMGWHFEIAIIISNWCWSQRQLPVKRIQLQQGSPISYVKMRSFWREYTTNSNHNTTPMITMMIISYGYCTYQLHARTRSTTCWGVLLLLVWSLFCWLVCLGESSFGRGVDIIQSSYQTYGIIFGYL